MFSQQQYRALRHASALVDRSSRARLRLIGKDRRDYLQGLLTNDIAALGPGTGCYAALLTAQGRLISDMYVIETGEAILLDLEPETGDRVFAHLERFIFSEDVQVENATASLAQIGVFGPASAKVVAAALEGARPEGLDRMSVLENRREPWLDGEVLVVRRDDIGVAGFDVVLESARAAALMDALRGAGAIDADADVADIVRVESGRPRFGRDMDEDTIPLEAGIEDRAVSMTKGCYVGQEIIIRVLHRGHGRVARRLVGLLVNAELIPQKGARIHSGDRDIGFVTSAVHSPTVGRPVALGYVHRDFTEVGTAVEIASGDTRIAAAVISLPVATAGEVGLRPQA